MSPVHLPPQAEISGLQQLLASKDAEIECLQTQLLARGSAANDSAEKGTLSLTGHITSASLSADVCV